LQGSHLHVQWIPTILIDLVAVLVTVAAAVAVDVAVDVAVSVAVAVVSIVAAMTILFMAKNQFQGRAVGAVPRICLAHY